MRVCVCADPWCVCVCVCEQVDRLLQHDADPTLYNKMHKTPLDLACEFGKYRVSIMQQVAMDTHLANI